MRQQRSSEPISKLVEPVDVKTGWFDAGVENGMNKLLPSVTLTLKNVSSEPVANIQLNAVIRRVGETEEWGGAFHESRRHGGHPARGARLNRSCCGRTSDTLASNRARRC